MGLVGDAWTDRQMSWEDYGRIFDQMLPEIVRTLDPEHDYWPGSPHTPPPGDRRSFNDPDRGDAHLWDVWHGRKPFEWYRTCTHRFNSEFGFQSFPEPKTVCGYTAPEDRNVTTYVMEHHQRSGIGNTVIMQYMLDWFRLPTRFEMTLWASQILQGMAMKYAVEHWRRAMPRGMGTLYWQLNDCWPVASWASLDYHGRWKALQHMARSFYAPLLLSGVEDLEKGTVQLHVTNDRRHAVAGTAAWCLTDLAGRVLDEDAFAVNAAAGANTPARTLDLKAFIERHGARGLLLWLSLEAAGEAPSRNLVLFARPKHLELEPPRITRRIAAAAQPGSFQVTLSARRPALWVWLELDGADAQISDNFFHLRPGAPVSVTITPDRPLDAGQLRRALHVRSLLDTYAT
jgi:beta-mannosidase